MVVFTCQHCNESLKRVAVSKHYSTKCRNRPYLTCVDCLKDFRGDDYNNHMTCVTEEERYGDKNFVAKKTGVKQTEWIDIVHLCAEKNRIPRFKYIFNKLSGYSNVPRKKTKFLNFIKSCMPTFSQDIAADVFHIIDEEFTKQKKKDTENENNKSESASTNEALSDSKEVSEKGEEKKNKKKRKDNSESETIAEEASDEQVSSQDKSEKKKTKKLAVAQSEKLESDGVEGLSNDKGKKKKDRQKNGFLNETAENVDQSENVSINNQNGFESRGGTNKSDNLGKLSKKELKKLKKKQKYEAELKNIEESESTKEMEIENETNEQEIIKSSKKQKKRKATVSDSEAGSGKRQKVEDNEGSESCTIENGVREEEKPQKGKCRFNWEETIKEVLGKNPDHEMPLKRISKKVLAEYQAVKGQRETYQELISKFNKKINKTVGVRVLKDKAKLISEDLAKEF